MKNALSTTINLTASADKADSPTPSFIKDARKATCVKWNRQLAQQKATHPEVRELGAMMITDQIAANDKLNAVTRETGRVTARS